MADQGGDSLVIHTMKDDLTGGGGKTPPPAASTPPKPLTPAPPSPAPSPASFTAPKPSVPVSKLPTPTPFLTSRPETTAGPVGIGSGTGPASPKPLSPPSKPPVSPLSAPPPASRPPAEVAQQFPLPPRPAQAQVPAAAIAAAPHVARRNRRRLFMWGGLILLLLLVLGGGGWAFITFVSAPAEVAETPQVQAAAAFDLIPASAAVTVHYRLESPAARSQMLELWQNSTKTLLQGNPKTLLSEPNVQEFMYVTIAGDSRPYLVVPKESVNDQLLSQFSQSQVSEHQEWYILHALNVGPYAEALAQGTVLSDQLKIRFQDMAASSPLQIYLGEAALNQIRAGSAGEIFAAGSVKTALISASPTTSGRALAFEGIGELSLTASAGATPTASQVDQAQLKTIPGDATFVRLGGNLAADIAAWQDVARVLDRAILNQTAVASLIRQLTGPYAYYHRLGSDSSPDIGLTFALPAAVTPKVSLGDTGLEQTLPAILPLVLAEKPAVALAFADATYQQTPLRFVNLSGSTRALDYTLEGNTLRLATSKEGMFAALDVANTRVPSLEDSEPWKTLLEEWGVVPITKELLLGYLNFSPLLDLLPSREAKLPAAITAESGGNAMRLSGVIVVNTQSPTPLQTSSAPTGTASPAGAGSVTGPTSTPSSAPTPAVTPTLTPTPFTF